VSVNVQIVPAASWPSLARAVRTAGLGVLLAAVLVMPFLVAAVFGSALAVGGRGRDVRTAAQVRIDEGVLVADVSDAGAWSDGVDADGEGVWPPGVAHDWVGVADGAAGVADGTVGDGVAIDRATTGTGAAEAGARFRVPATVAVTTDRATAQSVDADDRLDTLERLLATVPRPAIRSRWRVV